MALSKLRRHTLEYFAKVLAEYKGNRTHTADYLGVCVKTVRAMIYEMREYGMGDILPPSAEIERWPTYRLKVLAALKEHNYARKPTANALGIHIEQVYDAIFRLRKEGEDIPTRWAVRQHRKPVQPLCLRCKGKCESYAKMEYRGLEGPICTPCVVHAKEESARAQKPVAPLVDKATATAMRVQIEEERRYNAEVKSRLPHPTKGGFTRFGSK